MAAGARIGRNDPCPCGRGRKYKRCCLARDEAPELLRLRMRRAEGRLVPEVLQWNIELRETYFAIRDDIHHPRPPKLCNTDGDPLVPTTLRFDLRCPPGEAAALVLAAAPTGTGVVPADPRTRRHAPSSWARGRSRAAADFVAERARGVQGCGPSLPRAAAAWCLR